MTASTRTLAAELGLSKDTCARALRTLRSAELITVDATRTELGRFGTIRYRLTAPSRIIRTRTDQPIESTNTESPLVAVPPTTAPPEPRQQRQAEPEQLVLLASEDRS